MNIHHVGIVLPYQDSEWDKPLKNTVIKDHVKLFESLYCRELVQFKDVKKFHCFCYLYGRLEFIVPYKGKLLKWLEGNGPGLHHVAFEVADIRQTMRELKEKEYTLVCDEPVEGVGDTLVNFVHPKDTPHGMYEIVEVMTWR